MLAKDKGKHERDTIRAVMGAPHKEFQSAGVGHLPGQGRRYSDGPFIVGGRHCCRT